jgi:hypothetical protein
MNMGVVKSDSGNTTAAEKYYELAYADVEDNISTSTLVAKVLYNQAWELYNNSDPVAARNKIYNVIIHDQVNDFLKAKAYILRGVINISLRDFSNAQSDFLMAKNLDQNGPIGAMAEENILNIKDFEDEPVDVPSYYVLLPNYPNPFNNVTNIVFGIPYAAKVKLFVYDITGQKIKTLADGEMDAGFYSIKWHGEKNNGLPVTSGVYILSMITDQFTKSYKMILLR